MATIIFSDQMKESYSEYVTKCLQLMAERKPHSIAIVALCEDDECVTGYYGNGNAANDKALVMAQIQRDMIEDLVKESMQKYIE